MKFVKPDGTVEFVESKRPFLRDGKMITPITDHPGRGDREPFKLGPDGNPSDAPICGANKKNGGICHTVAGSGTNHKGYGRCYKHSGQLQEMGRGQLKWSLIEMETFPGIVAKANALRVQAEDKDVFDLRQHIYLMESIALTILEKAKTMEDLGAALQYIEKCTKVIQRLDEIEHGRKLVIDYQGVTVILAKVQAAIERNVRDSFTKDLIARDLTGILAEGIGSADITDNERPALVAGLAVEDRSGAGNKD